MTPHALAPARQIVAWCAAAWDVPIRDIYGPGRTWRFVFPRAIAIHIIRHALGWSTPHLGKFFNRDHTTILAAMRRAEKIINSDPWAAEWVRGRLEAVNGAPVRLFTAHDIDNARTALTGQKTGAGNGSAFHRADNPLHPPTGHLGA
jgi:hypothetical protein